jgi:glutaredoxin 3
LPDLIIYTKTGCPYCREAMAQYKREGIPFREINVLQDAGALKTVKEKYHADKVPVIVQDGKLVEMGYQGGG